MDSVSVNYETDQETQDSQPSKEFSVNCETDQGTQNSHPSNEFSVNCETDQGTQDSHPSNEFSANCETDQGTQDTHPSNEFSVNCETDQGMQDSQPAKEVSLNCETDQGTQDSQRAKEFSVNCETDQETQNSQPATEFSVNCETDVGTQDSQPAKEFIEKIFRLKSILTKDLLACDAKWTLFVSSALSYRFESQLKPFPSMHIQEDGCNIDSLINVIHNTPPLKVVLSNIVNEDIDELDTEVIDLLHWVLLPDNQPTLRTLTAHEIDLMFSQIPQTQACAKPNFVFEVLSSSKCKRDLKFQEESKEFQTCFAFHGSKLDSFYSILNYGLHQHVCKNALFGEGIYLSTELSVSLNYSPNSAAWGASICGSQLSCIALCEYVNNPDYVKSHVDDQRNTVPKKYIIVTNNDVVQVRYLLLYVTCSSSLYTKGNMAITWINQNKYALSISCYTLLLASIGIANNGSGLYLRHLFSKKFSEILEFFKTLFSEKTSGF